MTIKTLSVLTCGLTFFMLLCFSEKGKAQFMRQVVIYQDTVVEFQKYSTDDPNIPYGIDIHLWDSTGKTKFAFIKNVKNNELHGDSYMFDSITGLPLSKTHFENGLQNGISYYWNKKGELIRTERWKKRKLISKQ